MDYGYRGAEAWALLQATSAAFPGGCKFISDCKVMVDLLQGGRRKALEGSSSHARVCAIIIVALDDTSGVHHLDASSPKARCCWEEG